MAVSKPLLIPWLIEQIDSGQYPGVSWTNNERTKFCLPWKHGLRQDSSDDDVRIFKAWAEMSGGAHADASVWKRNFRSALRAKSCKMIEDNKNDPANPHKVYQLPPEEQHQQLRRYQEGVGNPSSGLPFASPSRTVFDNLFATGQGIVGAVPEYLCSAGGLSPGTGQDLLQKCLEDLNIEPHQVLTMHPTGVLPANMIPEEHSIEGAMNVDPEVQRWEELKEQMNTTKVDNILCTHFRVLAYYRGEKVLDQQVENVAGFKVVFRESLSPLPGSDCRLTPVCLPSPEQANIHDQTQARLTQRILDKLGHGLEVGVRGQAVYGLRKGDSKIYWSLCKFEEREYPREVSKQEPEMLYTLNDFVKGLKEFISIGGASPSFSLFFCLGEKWPDPEHRPWTRKLIMIEVIMTSLEILKIIAVDGGASSLQSVELQISGQPSLMDTLDEWMEMG
ncbi:hypothetical protein AAFF_G00406860 [Aldrovandia affinis]|uniref:IRF tryptophan pentad repeat domain-containing protein n=1 Tax=Aldrovandia affinis TaxID=143900 RepID=A0AAD7WK40_9TELE|nr:hypothetical protein AAFF_G00406860 [Aldrovandia affinis]